MLVTLEQAIAKVKEGKPLHIAADETLLDQLPRGNWIGGTTPYFISEEGGIMTKDKLLITEMDFGVEARIAVYGKYNIFQIVEECFDNGLTLLIMPFSSAVAAKYSKEAPDVEELLMHPIIGWISGYDLDLPGEAKVYDGTTGEAYTDKAVAMYIRLPEGKSAMVNMVNIFTDDKTDPVIRFPENDLSAGKCTINGQEVNLAEFLVKKGIDPQLPLVADHNGSYINTSIKAVENGVVDFFAPVFKNIEYRFAVPVKDYAEEFLKGVHAAEDRKPVFSCNCIRNFQSADLYGKKIPPFVGPVTFGEVAYQLVNQTLVYCEIFG